MASSFILTLDTVAPLNPSITFPAGSHTPVQLVNVDISNDDPTVTNYEMKIWGDVDLTYDGDVQDSEINSSWIPYNIVKQIKLASGQGLKTVYLKLRDDVYNETTQVFDTITYDTTIPIVDIVTGPDVTRISKVVGKNACNFSFEAVEIFIEYKVKVVPNSASIHTEGTTIDITNGSSNMSGTGVFPSVTPIDSEIIGDDLEVASPGDGSKVVKVFVKDQAGNWST